MILPKYEDGSIVNLMSSIGKSFGTKSQYKFLKLLPPERLKDSKNIVLLVIDGLGFHYLQNKKNSFLKKHVIGKMTSVFPATTAAAITTFLTGDAPQQHGITGWNVYLKELGMVVKILPFTARAGEIPIPEKLKIKDLLNEKCFSERINVDSFIVQPNKIKDSVFTKALAKKAKRIGFNSMNGMFTDIRKAITSNKRRKYIYAYWLEFDSLAHDFGVNAKKTDKHFEKIDNEIKKFAEKIKNTNTTLIITSDHGFIDTPEKRRIELKDHPELKECLTLPLCGEGRVAYCYVKPSKARQFEKYVKTRLKDYCYLYKSEDLIKKNYFGIYKPNPELFNRIGDYALIMKENYIFKDELLNEKKEHLIGNHAGITKEEMYVPLIVVNNG
ncbi:alkaline phosphatase family protein [Candidatus Woesearchaeota archaeon]|nr:alkaline phosphatase family protein [Candidatus Woesearchaeota archaeon]